MENEELSLHYTLTLDDNDDDVGQNDSTEVKENPTELVTKSNENNVNEATEMSNMSVDEEDSENIEKHDGNDNDNGDEDGEDADDDDEDAEENEKLRKEMEQGWAKEEAEPEKNQGMVALLMKIRNKHSPNKNSNKTELQKQQKQKTFGAGHPVPKINPFVSDGNLKITFDPMARQPSKKENAIAAHCNGHASTLQKRKRLKTDLKQQLHKKRKQDMKQYRKEFGRYHDTTPANKQHMPMQEAEESRTQSLSSNEECDDDGEHDMHDAEPQDKKAGKHSDDVGAEVEPTLPATMEYGVDIDDDDDEDTTDDEAMEEEERARAALVEKREVISKEVRELLDIAADEEDENGEVVTTRDDHHDEHEEKTGLASNLLAEKAEIKLLNKHKQVYDEKRNQIHRHMVGATDASDLELMKRAFIGGEYRKLQSKRRHKDIRFLNMDDGDGGEGAQALQFKSRNFELDPKNEPEFYLSDNEEKNESCCYDENGLFYDVHRIRMRVMEWNRTHNAIVCDDEEDKEVVESRQKRVHRRELLNNRSHRHIVEQEENDGMENDTNNKISKNDKQAVKILEKLRNKKRKKKPTLAKSASTMGINFDAFYKDKGLTIPVLQRNNSSSFLQCRNKGMDLHASDSTNQKSMPAPVYTPFSTSTTSSSKIVVFQNMSKSKSNSMLMKNSRKRRREDNTTETSKKRRTQ